MRQIVLAVTLALAASLAAPAAEPQGPAPGQIRPRPAEGRAPEFPAPSIVDYEPRSTLVVAAHEVPRAKFPVVDIHSHHPVPMTPDYFARVVASMDPLNLQLLVNLSGGSGDRLRRGLEAIQNSPHPDRMVLFANVEFRDVGPGFGARAARQLEADIEAGAVGLKIFKTLGLDARRADGTRLKVDDAELDPIWETCARLDVSVLIHTADPSEFFQPLDLENERWLELALFRDRRFFDRSRFPAFEELMGERDRMFAKHRGTRFIVAHMGWHAQDLGRLGAMLIGLPDQVLRKLYYGNALKVAPGLPRGGLPG